MNSPTRPTKKPRAARRCNICVGRPLKATCACSKRRLPTRGLGDSPNYQSRYNTPPGAGQGHNGLQTSSGGLPLSGPPPSETIEARMSPAEPGGVLRLNIPEVELSNSSLDNPWLEDLISPSLHMARETAVGIGGEPVADTVVGLEQAPGADTVVDLEQGPVGDTVAASQQVPPADSGTVRFGKKLAHVEKAAEYGFVEGAMRGNQEFRTSCFVLSREITYSLTGIVRPSKLRVPVADASTATSRYNRELPVIIARAERMSRETDAYVLLLAQQATGSSATIHFASSRLRREAIEGSATIVNKFQMLMTQLVLAKRATNLALAQHLEESNEALRLTQDKLTQVESVAERASGRLAEREAELTASQLANQELLAVLEAMRSRLVSETSTT